MSVANILWGQIIIVCLILVATMWGVTEWTAWRPGFQPELGRPWFELLRFPLYPPPEEAPHQPRPDDWSRLNQGRTLLDEIPQDVIRREEPSAEETEGECQLPTRPGRLAGAPAIREADARHRPQGVSAASRGRGGRYWG